MIKPIHRHMARVGQALSSPVRIRALNLLAQRAWTIGELAEELGESLASTSAHLKVLRAACLVVDDKVGRQVWCRIASVEVMHLLVATRNAAEALLPELREFVRQVKDDPASLQEITLAELVRELEEQRVTLLDLRPEQEYLAGHLPGALSLPFEKLSGCDISKLAQTEKVVAYCRGPYCAMARQGVEQLRALGISVKRLDAGVVEWQCDGRTLVASTGGSD